MELEKALNRLELMADGDPKWDLSDNDMKAIRMVLNILDGYRDALDSYPDGAALRAVVDEGALDE